MAVVDIQIQGRIYSIACDDGQENHVRNLARDLDMKALSLRQRMAGKVPDATLMVLASLMICDEANELRNTNKQLKNQLAEQSQALEETKKREIDSATSDILQQIAGDIEQLANQVEKKIIADS